MLSAATRRVPATLASRAALVRAYSSSTKEGSVAQSQGFNKKEKAHEDQYVREHEQKLLRKLRSDIEQKKRELRANESLQTELESKVKDVETK